MNYVLIMTEGKTEEVFLNISIEREMLIFEREDLLFDNIYHARQLNN